VYLIDNGYLLIVYTKLQAPESLIHSLFGVSDLSMLTSPVVEDNLFGGQIDQNLQKIINIIDYIRR
jgi:hypothetical protein